jgi:hypothetical protein
MNANTNALPASKKQLPAALPSLSEREARFAEHFAIYDDPAAAWTASGEVAPTTKRSSVQRAAYGYLSRPHVRARIIELRNAMAAAGPKATQAALVADLQETLAVDVAEIVRLDVVHCPSCYSSPAYATAWPDAVAAAIDAGSSDVPPAPLPVGTFDPDRDPWHACPQCLGAGRQVVRATPTDKLSAPARRLVRGYETHSDGSVKKLLLVDQTQLRQELHRTVPGFYAPDRSVSLNLTAELKPLKRGMSVEEALEIMQDVAPVTDETDSSVVSTIPCSNASEQ